MLTLLLTATLGWTTLAPGVEYDKLRLITQPDFGDGTLHVVRIDAAHAPLVFALQSQTPGGSAKTAQAWSKDAHLLVTINAGMFENDHSTHTGYLRQGKHVNSSTWTKRYKSLLAVGKTRAQLIDDADSEPKGFDASVQNLRLIKAPGDNVWSPSTKRWSEAAIAETRDGHILFLFLRTPLSMYDFNRLLLATDLGIVRAMHVEGGPEASLSIHAAGFDLDLAGSYETGFNENDDNLRQWPIPNVVGVAAR